MPANKQVLERLLEEKAALTNARDYHFEAANRYCAKVAELEKRIATAGDVLSKYGCAGICAHGICCVEKTCEECHMMDDDDWCIPCLITVALAAAKPPQG